MFRTATLCGRMSSNPTSVSTMVRQRFPAMQVLNDSWLHNKQIESLSYVGQLLCTSTPWDTPDAAVVLGKRRRLDPLVLAELAWRYPLAFPGHHVDTWKPNHIRSNLSTSAVYCGDQHIARSAQVVPGDAARSSTNRRSELRMRAAI